ncbi:MAG: hypothetical protein KDK65_04210 [Chlamydiia bacterium]|nr:hypothetical protein [Chlamydiia bacterium]
MYRSLDAVELAQGGTIIDVINRADKRELIDTPQMIRAMKELRDDIAHEYVSDRLQLLNEHVFDFVPTILSYIDRANHYAKQYIN